MNRSDDEFDQLQAFRLLHGTGLVEISLDQFGERIADVKRIVVSRLRELLDIDSGIQERDSAAYSLGTLAGLEVKLRTTGPKPVDPSEE